MSEKLVCNKCGGTYTDEGSIKGAKEEFVNWVKLMTNDGLMPEGISPCPIIQCGGELIFYRGSQRVSIFDLGKLKLKCNECGAEFDDGRSLKGAIKGRFQVYDIAEKHGIVPKGLKPCPNFDCKGNLYLYGDGEFIAFPYTIKIQIKDSDDKGYQGQVEEINAYDCPMCEKGLISIGKVFGVVFPKGILASDNQGEQYLQHYVCDKCGFRLLLTEKKADKLFQKISKV